VTYVAMYQEWTKGIKRRFADTHRADYPAEVWFSLDRNVNALEMLADMPRGDLLAIGAAFWVDAELLTALAPQSLVRADLVASEGIDVLLDGCALPFKDEAFDAVVCREVIEHVPDDRDLLWEIKRVLRPGGWLYISTPNAFNILPDGVVHVRGYSPLNFLKALATYGFEVIKKRGTIPNIHRALVPLSQEGNTEVLEEFKELAKMWNAHHEQSYYFGTELLALAIKK